MYKILLPILFLFLLSCNEIEKNDSKLTVVCTTGMIGDLLQQIGKDSINVQTLMGPGTDPHLYKATQGDLKKLQTADIIFYNGLHLEGKMGEIFEKMEKQKTVISLGKYIDKNNLIKSTDFDGNYDPHIWFDVKIWKQTILTTVQHLSEKSPHLSIYFTENAQKYMKELQDLDLWVRQEIQKVPKEKRVLITAHDAFGYFGKAYDIEVKGLQGISTLSEFSLRDRIELTDYIVSQKIKAVFIETSVSEKNMEAIIEGCKQKNHEVRIGGALYSDAMGPKNTLDGTYTGMIKKNVTTIVNALQ